MPFKNLSYATVSLAAEWSLPSTATLGSAVRAAGIERELRRRMPAVARKSVTVSGLNVVLRLPQTEAAAFEAASKKIGEILKEAGDRPILPREAEDILSISARERHKWLKDGRLQRIGTRTVKMRGRAKSVTFHVFDPMHIEELLNGDLPELWRQEDEATASDNRRRAAVRAALKRREKSRLNSTEKTTSSPDGEHPTLEGWDAFAAEDFLR